MWQPPPEPLLEGFARVLALERACVVTLNRMLVYRPCELIARTISRMGDGELWGVLIVSVAILPSPLGPRCALHLSAVALIGLALYVMIKRRACRSRPCVQLSCLMNCPRPLDEFSFPSGHTLHAVAFAVVTIAYFPPLGEVLAVFALLTGLVRMVLGLHYPSDVLAGVALGGGIALLSLAVVRP